MCRKYLLGSAWLLLTFGCETIPLELPSVADAGPAPDVTALAPDAALPADGGGFEDASALPDTGPGDAGPAACAPELSITTDRAALLPFGLAVIEAAGGTGEYRFEVVQNNSGGVHNPVSGDYVSGGVTGVTDTVRVTDLGCTGETEIDIRVVIPMQVLPSAVELPLSGTFRFQVRDGSGDVTYALVANGARGRLSPDGEYAASDREGVDRIEVTDVMTGERAEAVVTVTAQAALVVTPPRIQIAVGNSHRPAISGGSGIFDFVTGSPAVSVVDQEIVGVTPGRADFAVVDRFTQQSTQLRADVVAAQTFTATRAGDYFYATWIEGPGDLNGDGIDDAVVGHAEADLGAYNSGGVMVYQGQATGLDPAPTQIVTSSGYEDRMGRSFRVADVTGDGEPDLIVGAERSDRGATDAGSVLIFRGIVGGFFESEPSTVLNGRVAGDLLGFAVAVCDFNGDGRLDIAASSLQAEDRTASPVRSTQGSVSVFLGRETGFRARPDTEVFGVVRDAQSQFQNIVNLRMGWHIGAGDVDGDGACDLVASTFYHRGPNGGVNDGLIYVYKGVRPNAGELGGIRSLPSLGFASGMTGDINSQLGRFISVGDLDRDGKADIAASEYQHEAMPGRSNDEGGIRVFRGRVMSDEPLTSLIPSDQADFVYEGRQRDDEFGWTVRIQDADGDGFLDLLSGNWRDEDEGRGGDSGTITIFEGRDGAMPAPVVTTTIAGVVGGDRLGTGLGVVRDIDNNGTYDLIGFAPLNDFHGRDVGRLYVAPVDATNDPRPLDLPGQPAGDQFGRGVAIIEDFTGDGRPDLLVGAPLSDHPARGSNVGRVFVYPGNNTGFETGPPIEFSAFRGHSGGDYLGWRVSSAGDFDGDGNNDIAVVARFEDRPNNFNNTFAPTSNAATCRGTGSNRGAVYVWRGNGSSQPDLQPDFVFYGPQIRQAIRTVIGGMDINGDGFDDLVVGGLDWDRPGAANAGGFAVVLGQPADPQGRTVVICDAALQILGRRANDYLGRAMTPLGDLDADGCDDFAVGAHLEDLGSSNQGTVRVVYGWGGAGCAGDPRYVTLVPRSANAQAGFSLSGGMDVDGDLVPDIVVGAPAYRDARGVVGGAWLISGLYVNRQPRALLDGSLPTTLVDFVAPAAPNVRLLTGDVANAQFGGAVALVPGGPGRSAFIYIGSYLAGLSGTARSGGSQLFGWDGAAPTPGLQPAALAAFGGESMRPGGQLGRFIAGQLPGNRPVVAVSGSLANGVGLDLGAVYVLDLTP